MAREELRVAGLRLKLEGGAQLEQEMNLSSSVKAWSVGSQTLRGRCGHPVRRLKDLKDKLRA